MKKKPQRGSRMTDERALTISNNVSEEYIDLGRTDFATKEELCEAILVLGRMHREDWNRLRGGYSDILTVCGKILLNKKDTP